MNKTTKRNKTGNGIYDTINSRVYLYLYLIDQSLLFIKLYANVSSTLFRSIHCFGCVMVESTAKSLVFGICSL